MKDDKHDYSYFGSGISGYTHYKQTFNECFNKKSAHKSDAITNNKTNKTNLENNEHNELKVSSHDKLKITLFVFNIAFSILILIVVNFVINPIVCIMLCLVSISLPIYSILVLPSLKEGQGICSLFEKRNENEK